MVEVLLTQTDAQISSQLGWHEFHKAKHFDVALCPCAGISGICFKNKKKCLQDSSLENILIHSHSQ